MKLMLSFIFIFFSFHSGFSQQVKIGIIISDFTTKKNLPFANVYLKLRGKGTTTDLNGMASLEFERSELERDTLVCSYIGYEDKMIPVDLNKSYTLNIELSPSSINLLEVVVTNKKPFTAKQILKKVIKNTSNNYSKNPVNLIGLYREYVKEGNQYIQFNEALINLYYTKYPQKKLDRKLWKTWYYDDTYAFEYEGSLFGQFPRHFNTKEEQAKIMESRVSDNWSKYDYEISIVGGPLSLTGKDFIKYRYDFLNPKIFKKYNYILKQNEYVNLRNCYVLQFHPKDTKRRTVFDFSKKQRRSIYVGKLYIDAETFAVVKMEYKLATNLDFGFYKYHVPLDHHLVIDYKQEKDIWFIDKIRLSQVRKHNHQLWKGSKNNSMLYETIQEFKVKEIKKENVNPFPQDEVWKTTRLSTIRNHEWGYDSKFWEDIEKDNYPELSEEIKHDLEREIPLRKQFESSFKQKENLSTPSVGEKDFTFEYPFEKLNDGYQWFANPDKEEEVFDYLITENKYARNYIIPFKTYQKNYFESLNRFYPRDTSTEKRVFKKSEFEIRTDSFENRILYEYLDSIQSIPIFSYSEFLKECKDCFITSAVETFKNQLSFTYTDNGGLDNYLAILEKGKSEIIDRIANVYSYQWYDEMHVLYSKQNEQKRSDQIFNHNLSTKEDQLVYKELDLTYDLSLSQSKSYIVLTAESKDESEIYLMRKDSKEVKFSLLKKRIEGVKYSIKEFNNQIYILSNEAAINNKLYALPKGDLDIKNVEEIESHRKNVLIEDFAVTDNFLVLKTYKKSYPSINYRKLNDKKWKKVKFKNKIYDGSIKGWNNDQLQLLYSNPAKPFTEYKYDLNREVLTKIKQTKINDRFSTKYFKTERVWAISKDGTRVPITLMKSSAPKKKHKGLVLKVYGAYGAITGGYFDARDAILLRDGFTIAYAHVRGESIMGNDWYQDGKLLNKEHSFEDYIACAEHLIREEYTNPRSLIGYGNSAGGLIMGVVINRRPELFNTVILDHAYLDVLTTMMDENLPLTTDEYKEWGNPKEKKVYDYLKKYSPYQNIKKQRYPNLLLMASSNDYQTPLWQIAKYAAKVRANNTGDTTILFSTDFGSGHIGNTTGKNWMKTLSFQYAFVYGNLFD